MRRLIARIGVPLLATALGPAALLAPTPALAATATTYYVDCAASSNGSGTESSPWNSLTDVNDFGSFSPGDSVLFESGTTCDGELDPKGSGTSGDPITLDWYGTGARPIIDGGTSSSVPAALLLQNQQYWTVQDLEVTGGYYQNIYVTATNAGTYSGVTINNDTVTGNAYKGGEWVPDAGGVVVQSCNTSAVITGVAVTGVTAYDTDQSGIVIGHAEVGTSATGSTDDPSCVLSGTVPKTLVQNVTLKWDTSYNNDAAGIEVFSATDVLIRKNVLYQNGNGAGGRNAGLNGEGAWWDNTNEVTAEDNTVYGNYTGNGDGGGLDADGASSDNVISDNDIYDNDSYGVSVFAYANEDKVTTEIYGNTFYNNGALASRSGYGDIYIKALGNPDAELDGLAINNNTFQRTVNPGPAVYLHDADPLTLTGARFYNNTVIATTGLLMDLQLSGLACSDNTYEMASTGSPSWSYLGTTYTSLAAYQAATGQETGSTFSTPS